MKKKAKAIVISALVYLILSLFSIRKFLFIKGTIGHNWDWPFPALPYFFKYILSRIPYIWADRSIGYSVVNGLSPKIWWIYSSITGLIIGTFHTKFVILSTIVVGGISMFLLVDDILKPLNKKNRFFPSFIAGLFFAFSPFLFAEFVGGAISQAQTFVIIPLALYFFRRYIDSKKFGFLFLTSIIITFIVTSLHNFLFLEGILFSYIFVQDNKKEYLINLMKVNIAFVLLNIYWIIPFVYNLFTFSLEQYFETALIISDIIDNVPWITEILAGHGYIRPFFDIVLKAEKIYWLWSIIVFCFISFLFYILLIKGSDKNNKTINKKINLEILFWCFIFFTSMILATGAKAPFGSLALFLFKNISFFKIFRSPQHLITVPTIALGVLVGIGTSLMFKHWKNRFYKFLILGLILFWLYPSYITGDIGKDIHYDYKIKVNKQTKNWYDGDHIDFYNIAPGYKAVYSFLEKEKSDFKVLYLPMYASPYYHKTKFQLAGGGMDPLVYNSKHPSIYDDLLETFNPITALAEYDIYNKYDLRRFDELLKILNVKYIVLRKDVSPIVMKDRYAWDWKRIKDNIEFSQKYKNIYEDDYIGLYEKEEFLEHIYAANDVKILKNHSGFADLLKEGYNVSGKAVFIIEDFDNRSMSDVIGIFKTFKKRFDIKKRKLVYTKKYISRFKEEYEWRGSASLIKDRYRKGISILSANKSMGRAIKDFNADISYFDGDDEMKLLIFIDNISNMLPDGFNIFIDSVGGDMSNFFIVSYHNNSFVNGLNKIKIKKSEFRKGEGNPDWRDITRIGIDIYSKDNSTLNVTVYDWFFERNTTYNFDKMVTRHKLIFNNKTKIKLADFGDYDKWENGIKGDVGGVIAKSINSGMGRITKEVDLDLSPYTKHDFFKLRFNIPNLEYMHPNGFVIFFDSKNKDTSNMYFWDPRKGNFTSGINELIITKDKFRKSGKPRWDKITRIGFDVYSKENEFKVEFLEYYGYMDIPKGAKAYITQGGKEDERNVFIWTYEDTLKRKSYITGDMIPAIDFIKNNPVKYELYINAKNPYFLIFSERFHPDWRLYKGDVNWLSALFKKPLSNHFPVNGYANAWYVDKVDNGLEEKFTIYYFTQSIFVLSFIISLGFFSFFLVYFLNSKMMGRKKKKEKI